MPKGSDFRPNFSSDFDRGTSLFINQNRKDIYLDWIWSFADINRNYNTFLRQKKILQTSPPQHQDYFLSPCDARHEKTDLKVFVIDIPKEGWARMAAPSLLLVWQRLFRIWVFWLHRSYSLKVSVVPKEGWARPCAHPSFGLTTTKTLRSVFSWHASCFNDCFICLLLGELIWGPGVLE